MADISRILVDSEEVKDFSKVIENDSEIYIEESLLEQGDKVTLVYGEEEEEYQEAVFLSVDHGNLYKDLAVEVEIEFVKRILKPNKNFEIIVRAINRKDNRPGARFRFDRFYKQFAMGTGTGFRFNLNYFIFRIDLGMKLRDPSQSAGNGWIVGKRG